MARKAAFLDRDGTLNDERGLHYVHRVRDFHWIDGAREAIHKLNEAGFLVIVVTNQAGIARGLYTADDVDRLHDAVQKDLEEMDAQVDAF
ncbi:MAG: HAD-IIIA family hydrolase [Bacteroidetes bacterium]|nr:HAD-IIIA family hydrolase [Bacteroidota bacterium]